MNNSLALSSIAFSNKHTVINHLVTLHDVASSEKNSIVDGPFGSSLKTSDYVADGIPVLQGKNITGNKFKFTDIRFISLQKSKELIRSKVVVGDILVIKIGSIGYAAEIDDLGGYPYAIIPANLAKISIDKNKIVKNYLLQWLKTDSVKKYFESVASKTAQPALSLGKIKDLPVPLPPLAEQQRIAALLDTADNILKQRESAITKLDQLAQSVFVDMLGDLNINSKNLSLVKLKNICTYSQGLQVDVSKQYENKLTENDVRFLRIIDFTQGNQQPRYIENPSNKYYLHENEIAMVRYGATGFVCNGLSGVIANNLFKISIKDENFHPKYMLMYFKSDYF